MLVPVGGGGLVSGVAASIKRTRPHCAVVGVEPDGSDVMRRSRAAGRPIWMPSTHTIADGLRSDRTGEITFAHVQALVDEIVTVDDDSIVRTTERLLKDSKLIVEYSGATALAAVLSGRWKPEGRRTAVVLSGGNLYPSAISRLLANG